MEPNPASQAKSMETPWMDGESITGLIDTIYSPIHLSCMTLNRYRKRNSVGLEPGTILLCIS